MGSSQSVPIGKPLFIINQNGQAMNLGGWKDENGAWVIGWEKNDADNSKWVIEKVDDEDDEDWYHLLSYVSERAVHNQGATDDEDAHCTTWDASHPGDNLKVKFEPASGNYFRIVFKDSGKYIHIKDQRDDNGAYLCQTGDADDDTTQWMFEMATPPKKDSGGPAPPPPSMPDDTKAEWVKMPSCTFCQNASDVLEADYMTEKEAKQKCLSYGDEAQGFTCRTDWQNGDGLNRFSIHKTGAQIYGGSGNSQYYSMIYKVTYPPDDGTLFEDDFAETDDYVDCDWIRPGRGGGLGDDKKNICLFSTIGPEDIHQGGIGDCWLVCAFASLAEFPEAVKTLFSPQSIPADGKYTITLYSYAEKQNKQIEIDDRIPAQSGNTKFLGITDEGEIWPCLLEKAFAKYSGSYAELVGGNARFAFGALAGTSEVFYANHDDNGWHLNKVEWEEDRVAGHCTWHNYADDDKSFKYDIPDEEFLQLMADWDNNNYLMGAGTHGHQYSILQVKVNVAGSGFDLIQMRNPWGSGDLHTGENLAWNDKSSLWNDYPEVAEECGFEAGNDGLFWITFDDYCSYYGDLSLCMKDMGENRGKRATREFQCPNPAFEGPDGEIEPPMKVSCNLQKKRTIGSKVTKAMTACGGPPCSIM
eukprot:gnl/MRDRNA2_/MRDRNA2_40449_c0_seq1.p1 gnl/MRDRNA2_/MRDRNA2_40449_c0~~gnl/MRDRNA2_/MRDRNA2_40449_c0_seq1.p1  ORF type:complete len:641 (-),score=117.98 gnl/MRDRNA2_/MRDRNA2_40449_c0_seq1:208-2130(-)